MGRKHQLLVLAVLLLTVTFTPIYAQFTPAPVEKSSQKILFKGRVYFVHTIKPNQTIHSISRAYGVTYQDIAAANPNITLEVIKAGQVLRIPEVSTLDTLSESYFNLNEADFYYHTVEPQQTVTYLTAKYNVSEEIIYKYNPGSQEVIQIGQVIKIPKAHVITENTAIIPGEDTLNTYRVKPGDTLYTLAKTYGVTVADFITENPDLRWGLKTGMVLKIPGQGEFANTEIELYDDALIPGYNGIEIYDEARCNSIRQSNYTSEMKIVLMLPFHVEETMVLDTIMNDSVRKAHPYNRQKSIGRNFIEFYQGFLIALDSIKATGKKATVFTYDTRFDTNETDKIIKELEIIRPDLIVGPVSSDNIKRVSAFSDSNKIPLILPLSRASSKLTNKNPYAITLLPDFKSELDMASNFLAQFYDKNVILIHNQDSARMGNLNLFRESLFAHFSSNENYERALYKELRTNDTLNRNLAHTLRNDIENVVIIISNNEAFVSNIVGLLAIQDPLYKIQVFGLPAWQKFKNLRVDQLHTLNATLYSPFFIDYTKPSTKRFIELSRNKLGYEPYRTVSNGNGYNFTYLGYETGLIFSKAFVNYGTQFINCMCEITEDLPQLNYEFMFNTWGGFRTNTVNFINYSLEYNLERIGDSNKSDSTIPNYETGENLIRNVLQSNNNIGN